MDIGCALTAMAQAYGLLLNSVTQGQCDEEVDLLFETFVHQAYGFMTDLRARNKARIQ